MTTSPLFERVIAGDGRSVARAISLLEDGDPSAAALVSSLRGRDRRADVVGVTGPAGSGKSTLVNRLIGEYRRGGRRVAVLAVDPSSPLSGGAMLGDRVRMQEHARDEGVFIRSLATRGHLGGLTRTTADSVSVLDAAGFDTILIETVGVGQAEVEVAGLADVVVLVLAPGAGDDIQALKAGLMEVADIFVVNKADWDGADRLTSSIEAMLSLADLPVNGRQPPVVQTVATESRGVSELVAVLATLRSSPKRRRLRLGNNTRHHFPVDHVGIATGSLQTSVRFLADVLGLPAGVVEEVPSQGVRVQFLGGPSPAIELVEPSSDTSPVATFLERRGPGLHHLAIRVDDLEGTLARLKARGVRLVDEHPRSGAHGSRVAFIHPASADGVLIELVERVEQQGARDADR